MVPRILEPVDVWVWREMKRLGVANRSLAPSVLPLVYARRLRKSLIGYAVHDGPLVPKDASATIEQQGTPARWARFKEAVHCARLPTGRYKYEPQDEDI